MTEREGDSNEAVEALEKVKDMIYATIPSQPKRYRFRIDYYDREALCQQIDQLIKEYGGKNE